MELLGRVAVVILNFQTWQETVNEIKLMRSITGIRNCDYIIVDNNSSNDSVEQLSRLAEPLNYELLISDSNGGYAKGNNIGLRYAYKKGYRYCWIMNNDILFKETFDLSRLLKIFDESNDIAVVNPDVYSPSGELFNRDVKRWSILDMTIGLARYKKIGRAVHDLGGWSYVYRPQGCSMIMDLEKCSQVGFLDEHTFLYCEEPILAERLLKANYRCAVDLKDNIVHNHSKTVRSLFSKKRIIQIHSESFRYYLQQYRSFNPVQVWLCVAFKKAFLMLSN